MKRQVQSLSMAAFQSAFLFPPNRWHNHAPGIVECPNGDLLACWFSGSGEREADDVQILGARKRADHSRWSRPFLMADTPDYPDCNPCLFIDPRQRLWLMWITILNHRWEGSLLKYRRTRAYQRQVAPRWQEGEVLHISPDAQFVKKIESYVQRQREQSASIPPPYRARFEDYLERLLRYAHDELSRRLGWMTRQPPLIRGNRLWLPLYSDGFDCSLIAISDDGGDSWRLSEPILAPGAIQPTLLKRRDGSLVAYMRDNGPPPNRAWMTVSHDEGFTWSEPVKTAIPNPGSSVAALTLRTGEWIMVCNDTEQGRHQLAILISTDEGQSWQTARYLEQDSSGKGRYAYPTLIQAQDGTIHVVYSHATERGSTIRWAQFTREWLWEGLNDGVLD